MIRLSSSTDSRAQKIGLMRSGRLEVRPTARHTRDADSVGSAG